MNNNAEWEIFRTNVRSPWFCPTFWVIFISSISNSVFFRMPRIFQVNSISLELDSNHLFCSLVVPLQLDVTRYKIQHTGEQNNMTWLHWEIWTKKNYTFLVKCVWLILESGIFFCSPICWILYHVTSSCKGPISYSKLTEKHQTVSEDSVTTQGAPTPRICDKSINLPCALLLFCERFLPGLIDRQASRSGFCRSGYRSRRRGLFFYSAWSDDSTNPKQTLRTRGRLPYPDPQKPEYRKKLVAEHKVSLWF